MNIAVVGCGAIGLTTAIAIQNALPKTDVTIFARDFTPNTTSDVAAGLWEPYLLQDTPPEKVSQWSKATYDYLLKLWKQGKAKDAGIILQPATYLTDDESYTVPDWANMTIGHSVIQKDRLIKLAEIYNQELKGGLTFTTFTWEAPIFLPYLEQEFLENGGRVIKREVKRLEELEEYDVIVNCTGLGAKELTGDENMKPIRGQIVRVNTPWLKSVTMTDTKKACYIIPNTQTTILGGTKQENYNLEVDSQDTDDILRKCSEIVAAVKSAEIIKHQVGLRPARNRVRLEVEIKENGNKKKNLRIVHNYGHGGAGITLCMGCAEEAAKLVRDLVGISCKL